MAESKENLWDYIEQTIFWVGLLLILISIPLAFNSTSKCPVDEGTTYSLIISLSCNYGLQGLAFFAILTIVIMVSVHLLIKNKQKDKRRRRV